MWGYIYMHTMSTVAFLPFRKNTFTHPYFKEVGVMHYCNNLKINYLWGFLNYVNILCHTQLPLLEVRVKKKKKDLCNLWGRIQFPVSHSVLQAKKSTQSSQAANSVCHTSSIIYTYHSRFCASIGRNKLSEVNTCFTGHRAVIFIS